MSIIPNILELIKDKENYKQIDLVIKKERDWEIWEEINTILEKEKEYGLKLDEADGHHYTDDILKSWFHQNIVGNVLLSCAKIQNNYGNIYYLAKVKDFMLIISDGFSIIEQEDFILTFYKVPNEKFIEFFSNHFTF